ncbi:MAG: hypothetical protein QOG32_166 [Chloroflexota bacterium]|nr:hypothetical protein [Chloroflexota bacterium]
MTLRRPLHLFVLAGASAGIYSVSLAGVTFLQSSVDRALIAERAPFDQATTSLVNSHDALDTDITKADQAYADAAARYDLLTPQLAGMETSLDALAGSVSTVSGAAKALPAHAPLPKVTRSVSTSSTGGSTATARAKAPAPVSHAKTGPSGGG